MEQLPPQENFVLYSFGGIADSTSFEGMRISSLLDCPQA